MLDWFKPPLSRYPGLHQVYSGFVPEGIHQEYSMVFTVQINVFVRLVIKLGVVESADAWITS